jgi:hypothetical protein
LVNKGGMTEIVILWIIIAILLGFAVYLPIRAIRKWQGGWKLTAYLPLVLVVVVLFIVVIGKGGNLFPFVIIIYSGASLAITGIMYGIRALTKKAPR